MYKIKAEKLEAIAIAAECWLRHHNKTFDWSQELQEAVKLRKELQKTIWDEDAELMIDEMPF